MATPAQARLSMVDCQLRPNSVTDTKILTSMGRVPREKFVGDESRHLAYIDKMLPLNVGNGRTLIEPMVCARLLQLADIKASDIVLDVACATGYCAAILSDLAATVVALDDNADLVDLASQTLAELDIGNVAVIEGDITKGKASEAPFDVIVIEGAVETVPQGLFDQLADGGRLVTVLGKGQSGLAALYTKSGNDIAMRTAFNTTIAPLTAFDKKPEFQF